MVTNYTQASNFEDEYLAKGAEEAGLHTTAFRIRQMSWLLKERDAEIERLEEIIKEELE